jgi:hypothetical protein
MILGVENRDFDLQYSNHTSKLKLKKKGNLN